MVENKLLQRINTKFELIPNHKELEALIKQGGKIEYTKYTITGLYSSTRIKSFIKDKEKFNVHVKELQDIINVFGDETIFSPVISMKAVNKQTAEIFIQLQIDAGFKNISIIEPDIHQNGQSSSNFFKNKLDLKELKNKNIIPFLSLAMQGKYLLSNKLKAMKILGFNLVNISFTGYYKYRDNLLLILGAIGKEYPDALISCVWSRVNKTSCPPLTALYNPRYVSSGYKWGASNKKDKNVEILDEDKIEFYSLSKTEKTEMKTNLQLTSDDDLIAYLKAESFIKNKRIIDKLSKLEQEKLNELIKTKEALMSFF